MSLKAKRCEKSKCSNLSVFASTVTLILLSVYLTSWWYFHSLTTGPLTVHSDPSENITKKIWLKKYKGVINTNKTNNNSHWKIDYAYIAIFLYWMSQTEIWSNIIGSICKTQKNLPPFVTVFPRPVYEFQIPHIQAFWHVPFFLTLPEGP